MHASTASWAHNPMFPLTAITIVPALTGRLIVAPNSVKLSTRGVTSHPSRVMSSIISRGIGPPKKRESPLGRGELPRTRLQISSTRLVGQGFISFHRPHPVRRQADHPLP